MNRRHFLQTTGLAMTGAATLPGAPIAPMPKGKAEHVIFIWLGGGMAQIDTFDPKRELDRYHGKPLPIEKPEFTFAQTGNVLKSPWRFRRYGECGLPVSSLFPEIGRKMDDICVIRSMQSSFVAHGGATLQLHTGDGNLTRPSLGSWLMYGLGTENSNLPGLSLIHI